MPFCLFSPGEAPPSPKKIGFWFMQMHKVSWKAAQSGAKPIDGENERFYNRTII